MADHLSDADHPSDAAHLGDAFYHRDHDQLIATALTRGPWSIDQQHGGPPSAALAGAFAPLAPADAWQPARFTIEFLRPVLVAGPLRTSAEVTRSGKQALGLAGTLLQNDRPVARASALYVRRLAVELPPAATPAAAPRDPDASPAFTFPFFRWELGYHTAIDGRLEAGAIGGGPATAWLRSRVPLIADEPTSPLQQVLIVADAINGVGFGLDLRRFTFINADLTVYLHRLPVDPWIRLATSPNPQPTGVGLVEAELADRLGPIGRALEAQVIAPRGL